MVCVSAIRGSVEVQTQGERLVPGGLKVFLGRRLRTVQGKFLAIVVPLVLLSTLLVFGFFELTANRASEAQLRTKLKAVVDIQALVLQEPVWNVADDPIALALEALLTDSEVVAVMVQNEFGVPLVTVDDREMFETSDYVGEGDIVYGFGDDQSIIGRLQVALTNQRLLDRVGERAIMALFLSLVLVVGVVFAANRRKPSHDWSTARCATQRDRFFQPDRKMPDGGVEQRRRNWARGFRLQRASDRTRAECDRAGKGARRSRGPRGRAHS